MGEEKIIYKNFCYQLNKLFFELQNQLGNCLPEKQYADGLEALLKMNNVPYEREKELYFEVAGEKIEGNRADFIAYKLIAIDTKTKKYINKEDYRQMLRYLKAGKYKLGLIVNFRGPKVIVHRIVNSDIKIKDKIE